MATRLVDRKFITLSDTGDLFILFKSTEEECSELKNIIMSAGNSSLSNNYKEANKICFDIFGYNINEIVAYGSGGLDKFTKAKAIDSIHIPYRDDGPLKSTVKKTIHSFKCFAGCDWKHRNIGIVIHECADASWNCAMEVLKFPEAMILIKVKKHG